MTLLQPMLVHLFRQLLQLLQVVLAQLEVIISLRSNLPV
jgi:hypothetical protein